MAKTRAKFTLKVEVEVEYEVPEGYTGTIYTRFGTYGENDNCLLCSAGQIINSKVLEVERKEEWLE